MSKLAFFGALGVIGWVYLGYPVVLYVVEKLDPPGPVVR